MIHIEDKSRCCGCEACASVCPKQCIRMEADGEGFLYPKVNELHCVDCGKCERVCQELHQQEPHEPLSVWAAKGKDERERLKASSGGVFMLLAESVIDEGGVVFGAMFDEEWAVVHDYVETKEKLGKFRGSKYVQSRIGNTFRQAADFLESGRKVMFTGTSCQIAGLRKFLNKNYDNLLTVDVVCHGVPSPLVWKKYLEELTISRTSKCWISDISFKNKCSGWKNYSFTLAFSDEETCESNPHLYSSVHCENAYMGAFLSNLSLRLSCYACPAKAGKSGSDITLGDFWGIENALPDFDDDKGVSLVMVHTEQGDRYVFSLNAEIRKTTCDAAIQSNSSIVHSVFKPTGRHYFFYYFKKKGFHEAWRKVCTRRLVDRVIRKIFSYL